MKPGAALAAQRKVYRITCEVCGKKAKKRDPRAKYCSRTCNVRAFRARQRGEEA